MAKQLHEKQIPSGQVSHNRLWEHGMHAESVFLNQLNFFLIFESLLLGGVINGILTNPHGSGKPVLISITIFGCFITIFWLCIQYSQGYLFEKLKTRLEEQLPEYQETLKQRRGGGEKFSKLIESVNNLTFQAISIPGLVVLAWFGVLLYALLN